MYINHKVIVTHYYVGDLGYLAAFDIIEQQGQIIHYNMK